MRLLILVMASVMLYAVAASASRHQHQDNQDNNSPADGEVSHKHGLLAKIKGKLGHVVGEIKDKVKDIAEKAKSWAVGLFHHRRSKRAATTTKTTTKKITTTEAEYDEEEEEAPASSQGGGGGGGQQPGSEFTREEMAEIEPKPFFTPNFIGLIKKAIVVNCNGASNASVFHPWDVLSQQHQKLILYYSGYQDYMTKPTPFKTDKSLDIRWSKLKDNLKALVKKFFKGFLGFINVADPLFDLDNCLNRALVEEGAVTYLRQRISEFIEEGLSQSHHFKTLVKATNWVDIGAILTGEDIIVYKFRQNPNAVVQVIQALIQQQQQQQGGGGRA